MSYDLQQMSHNNGYANKTANEISLSNKDTKSSVFILRRDSKQMSKPVEAQPFLTVPTVLQLDQTHLKTIFRQNKRIRHKRKILTNVSLFA